MDKLWLQRRRGGAWGRGIGLVAALLLALPLGAEPMPVQVGAIRWDAWHGERGGPGRAVERSLGPQHWHYRLPFYGRVVGPNQVEVRGDSQEVMDREIAYAAAGGLDYWAFGYYHPLGSPMSSCLPLYLASPLKERLKFCLWLENLGPVGEWPETARGIANLLREPTYVRVLGDRPLVYLHGRLEERFGSLEAARAALATLRAAAAEAGVGRPYVVLMESRRENERALLAAGDADAVSGYAITGSGEGRRPYAELAAAAERKWEAWRQEGWPVVALASSGWDRRPRQENPVPWEKGAWTLRTLHYDPPTPDELGSHIRRAVEWTTAQAAAAPAQTVLIYAWNETDEGGWLVPTLQEGSARLDAIARALGREPAVPPQGDP